MYHLQILFLKENCTFSPNFPILFQLAQVIQPPLEVPIVPQVPAKTALESGEVLPLAERLKKSAERLRKLGANGMVGKQMLVLDGTSVLRFLVVLVLGLVVCWFVEFFFVPSEFVRQNSFQFLCSQSNQPLVRQNIDSAV